MRHDHFAVRTKFVVTADGKRWIVCADCGDVVVPAKYHDGWSHL